MKLSEIKLIESSNVDACLMLKRILQKGKADNVADFFALARVLMAYESGCMFSNANVLFDSNTSIPKALLDHLKSLEQPSILVLTSKLLQSIECPGANVPVGTNAYSIIDQFVASEANE
jgi:hypothetical protein